MSTGKKTNNKLPFGRKNYMLMLVGLALLIIGFTLMAMDTHKHGFGFLGLTFGPLVVLAGFVTEFFAILAKSGDKEQE